MHQYTLLPHIDQIDEIFNADSVEEIVENLKKDGGEWAQKQLDIMQKMVR